MISNNYMMEKIFPLFVTGNDCLSLGYGIGGFRAQHDHNILGFCDSNVIMILGSAPNEIPHEIEMQCISRGTADITENIVFTPDFRKDPRDVARDLFERLDECMAQSSITMTWNYQNASIYLESKPTGISLRRYGGEYETRSSFLRGTSVDMIMRYIAQDLPDASLATKAEFFFTRKIFARKVDSPPFGK